MLEHSRSERAPGRGQCFYRHCRAHDEPGFDCDLRHCRRPPCRCAGQAGLGVVANGAGVAVAAGSARQSMVSDHEAFSADALGDWAEVFQRVADEARCLCSTSC